MSWSSGSWSFMKFNIFMILLVTVSAFGQTSQRRSRSSDVTIWSHYRNGLYPEVFYSRLQRTMTTTPSQASDYDQSMNDLGVKLGYINAVGIYFGAGYNWKKDSLFGGNSEGRSSCIGFGYFTASGFDLRAYARFHESYGQYLDGAGYQFNLGYSAPLTSQVYLGFSAEYIQTTYKKNYAIANFDQGTLTSLNPSITLALSID